MSDQPVFSVVICYRNWGGERLRLAVESHLRSTLADSIEVIVSDFGSDAERKAETLLADKRVRCVYTDTDEPWSRSRSLNAGIAEARGEYILAWDADILCAPELHEELLAHFQAQPNSAYPLHCRDLDASLDEDAVRGLLEEHGEFPMDVLREHSEWRPRWGMGIAAYRREHFDLVRGYDERFVIWGGEDRDLVNRLSRLGVAIRWIDSPAAQIFHIYHGSSQDEAAKTTQGQTAVTRNHEYVQRDRSIFRNLSQARYLETQRPLVSVVVASHNRSNYLAETIPSVLNQTFRDFELIIVDDGSSDDTQEVLKQFGDPRLVVLHQENAGVAAARNNGIRHARGHFMLVHDDDDIMLPDRLEVQLAALDENSAGSYGGWVDFNDETGELVTVNSGKDFSAAAIAYAGKVLLHPTVMTTRWVAGNIPYDERYKGGSDFNWMMTIAANGAELVHTGNIHILRRLHGASLTSGGSGQKHASRASARASHSGFGREALEELRTLGRETESIRCRQEENLDELYQHLPERLRKKECHFSAVLDDESIKDVLEDARQHAGKIILTSIQPVYMKGVSIIGLNEVHGVAETAKLVQACFAAKAHSLESWWSHGPAGGRQSLVEYPIRFPSARSPGFTTAIASQLPDAAWALLGRVADVHSLPSGSTLLAVKRVHSRRRRVRLGKVDGIMRAVSPAARRLCVLQTPDGVVPVYLLDNDESTAHGLRRLASAWSIRNLSVIAYQCADDASRADGEES